MNLAESSLRHQREMGASGIQLSRNLRIGLRKGAMLLCTVVSLVISTAFSGTSSSWLPPIRESGAYQQFAKRTYSELSKLLYLIDRYKDTAILVIYDGAPYDTAICLRVVRWFLPRYYHNERAEEWVKRYCSTSILFGNPIFVKLPDGTRVLATNFLLEELRTLKEVYETDFKAAPSRTGRGT